MIELRKVTKIYDSTKGVKTTALQNIDLKLENSGMVFIVGKSGSGKSTLLNIISGLDKYEYGDILINGKSLNSFKNKDYDSYRNTNIGFIFQDFNLLNEYNVYQNIELSMNLQRKKISKIELDKLLEKVGLKGLGKRKINELSGGQKQRVAIARALIKNPTIILADEPTGSLDSETSRQILELLKQISKDTLVISVSHDMESAYTYADRIIQLSDGSIVVDNGINEISDCSSSNKFIKSRLPMLSSFKLSLANLKSKKIRLFFTILLITFALSFFGLSFLLSNYNLPHSHAVTMIEEKESTIAINKNLQQEDGTYQSTSQIFLPFNDKEVKYFETALNKNVIKVNSLYENGQSIKFNIPNNITAQTPVYYSYLFSQPYFIELDGNKEFDLNIIGHLPKEQDEIVIHKYIADYIIYNGIYLYLDQSIESNRLKNPELYRPTDYQKLLNDNQYIQLGTNKVKIVGIIDEDLSKYEVLKKISYGDINRENEKLTNDFVTRLGNKINNIYVAKGFLENISLYPNNTVDFNDFLFSFTVNEKDIPINSSISKLTEEKSIVNDVSNLKINNLNNDEIIINKEYLNAITNYEFDKQLTQYLEKTMESSTLTVEQMENDYIIKYLKSNDIIGKNINLKITDYNKKVNSIISTRLSDVKIVGYSNSDYIYLSNNILDKYMHPKFETMKIYFFSNDLNYLEKVFSEIPLNHSKYTIETNFSNKIISIEDTLNTISQFAFYSSIVFFIFAMILLINFVSITITSNKKQIGILRALGTRKIDIFKIYLLEGLFIGLCSLILSVVICYFGEIIGNILFADYFGFNIRPIMFTGSIIINLSLSVLLIVLISSFIPSYKISSMNPIDAIYEK